MEMHFATVWEAIADTVPDAPALVHGDQRWTWSEYDDRAARLTSAFAAAGLGPDSKVGLYLYNCNEYLEAQYAGFKLRAVPVNVNYRYLDEELRYLLENADAEAIVFHSSLGERVARIRDKLPLLKLLVEVDDGGAGAVPDAIAYEEAIATNEPARRVTRREDDVYMLYTGGTTGMPKGVVYEIGGLTDSFIKSGYPTLGLAVPTGADQITGIVAQALANGIAPVSIPACPLMHGTGVWLGALIPHVAGGCVVTSPHRRFDANEMFITAAKERAGAVVIVGDAFARPMVRSLEEAAARGEPHDTSTLTMIVSSGVMFQAELKEQLLDHIPQAVIIDVMGSSEGAMAISISMRGLPAQTAKFSKQPGTKVFTDDGREVHPGSGEIGMVAAGGTVPVSYFKDQEKSAQTFRTIDGVRYSFPGDIATIAHDGSIVLLGRGSQVINSAGEKIFAEEVEEAVKRVPGIADCLVVGLDDPKYGQAVTAVAAVADGASVDEAAVVYTVKSELAGFKAPQRVVFVDVVPRAPNGKADYATARLLATAALTKSEFPCTHGM